MHRKGVYSADSARREGYYNAMLAQGSTVAGVVVLEASRLLRIGPEWHLIGLPNVLAVIPYEIPQIAEHRERRMHELPLSTAAAGCLRLQAVEQGLIPIDHGFQVIAELANALRGPPSHCGTARTVGGQLGHRRGEGVDITDRAEKPRVPISYNFDQCVNAGHDRHTTVGHRLQQCIRSAFKVGRENIDVVVGEFRHGLGVGERAQEHEPAVGDKTFAAFLDRRAGLPVADQGEAHGHSASIQHFEQGHQVEAGFCGSHILP